MEWPFIFSYPKIKIPSIQSEATNFDFSKEYNMILKFEIFLLKQDTPTPINQLFFSLLFPKNVKSFQNMHLHLCTFQLSGTALSSQQVPMFYPTCLNKEINWIKEELKKTSATSSTRKVGFSSKLSSFSFF